MHSIEWQKGAVLQRASVEELSVEEPWGVEE